jgi:serine/threonine-protein kinase HipA
MRQIWRIQWPRVRIGSPLKAAYQEGASKVARQKMSELEVGAWGRRVGAVTCRPNSPVATFRYDPEFLDSGIEISPLVVPLSEAPHEFGGLRFETFRGLPGVLADSLPDKFGRAVAQAWLARKGGSAGALNPLDQLRLVGDLGVGALEYHPGAIASEGVGEAVDIRGLVLASDLVLGARPLPESPLTPVEYDGLLEVLIRTSASAGGARAKALLMWSRSASEFRIPGHPAGDGFEDWLIKFDGVTANRNDLQRDSIGDPLGYTVAEFVYSMMARSTGIEMSDCLLLEEGGRRHFMTRRFDRRESGEKLHMLTLGGMAHLDFNDPGANSYEAAFRVLHDLELGEEAVRQLYLRMLFNVVSRNHDDHVKNVSFLMDSSGKWSLAPAYDLAYNNNPNGWTRAHQMSINNKNDDFTLRDLLEVAGVAGVASNDAIEAMDAVRESVSQWDRLAREHGVPSHLARAIGAGHRLRIP